MDPSYRRILLKLSGEALMGEQQFGIDPGVTTQIAKEISEIQGLGIQTAIVIGGGNLFRGLAAGTGNPYFTTDTAAALRAMEMKADVILKGTKVDGIYTADPMLDPEATKFQEISYLQVLERQLKVMDATAISLCMDNKLPIVVFNLRTPGNMCRVITGEPVGTTVGV